MIGAMASKGYFNIFLVYLIVVFAGVLGAVTCYYIGYFLGRPVIDFIERKIPKTKKPLHKVDLLFNKYSYLSVCIGRVIPFTRSYISLIAGVEKINIFKFCIFTAFGIGIWDLILILPGYFLGSNISFIEFYFEKNIYVILSIGILIIIVFIIYKLYRKRKK